MSAPLELRAEALVVRLPLENTEDEPMARLRVITYAHYACGMVSPEVELLVRTPTGWRAKVKEGLP